MTTRYRVVARKSVSIDLARISEHIERWTEDQALAYRAVDQIRGYIRGLCDTPHRGTKREDLRPSLRIVPFRKRAAIAIEIDESTKTVTVLRVFYGGQDYEAAMRTP